jgi:hypothetical protein
MPAFNDGADHTIREAAYFIWKREGRPDGRAEDHWLQAVADLAQHDRDDERIEDEEKILAGRLDANMPALLTKDVSGG